MSDDPETPDYEVGYGRPPIEHQFQPGRSGNPRGRPRKRMRTTPSPFDYNEMPLVKLVREVAATPVPTKDHRGRIKEVPLLEAAVRRLALDAAQGKRGAQAHLMRMVLEANKQDTIDRQRRFRVAVDYIEKCHRETRAAISLGRPVPRFLPDPRDFVLDCQAGTADLRGPYDEKSLASYDEANQLLDKYLWLLPPVVDVVNETGDADVIAVRHNLQRQFDDINDRMPISLQRYLPDRSWAPEASKPGDRSPTEHFREGAIAAAQACPLDARAIVIG